MNIINRNLVVVFHLLLSSSPCIFRCLLQRAKLLLVWVMGMLSNHPTAISPASLRGGGSRPPPPETVAAAVIVVGGDMSEPREGEGGRGREREEDGPGQEQKPRLLQVMLLSLQSTLAATETIGKRLVRGGYSDPPILQIYPLYIWILSTGGSS